MDPDPHLETLLRFFTGMPREGPGDDRYTEHLYRLLIDLPAHPRVADMGSGSGAATLVLARSGARVTAVDLFAGPLKRLEATAAVQGLERCVRTIQGSMVEVPATEGPFDLIWSEGAIYSVGFEAGLRAWGRLLTPGGYVVVSEISWLLDDPPDELSKYWTSVYPGIQTVAQNAALVARTGYRLLGSVVLPDAAWDTFYAPQRVRCGEWRARGMTPDEESLVREVEEEIRIHETYRGAYGYVFYLMQWPA